MLISVLVYACFALTAEASGGFPECPCITNQSVDFAAIQEALLSAGLPQSYGLAGCKAYDNSTPYVGCSSNALASCLNPWCYVDTELCRLNKEVCLAAGGKIGSNTSAYCRERRSYPSGKSIINVTFPSYSRYSYETCGSLDLDHIFLRAPAGEVIKAAVDVWAPWIVTRVGIAGKTEYGGALFDTFAEALQLFDPVPTLQIIPGWATEASRAKFASSYTACVHDVAIGNFDICIADLWITPERARMTEFTLPLRHDYFYLVTPKEFTPESFVTKVKKVSAPLTDAAWGQVVIFLASVCVIIALIRMWDGSAGHFNKGCRVACKYMLGEICLTCFDIEQHFLGGSISEGGTQTMANMVVKTGLAFFTLIIIASYTASLASLLVVQKDTVAKVANIIEAINQDTLICVPTALLGTLSNVYHRGAFVAVEFMEDSPKAIYAGKCGVAILSQGVLDAMHAGDLKKSDCDKVANGDLTEAEAFCRQGFPGMVRNDCDIIRVDDVLFSIPVGYPVSDRFQHGFSWAFSELSLAGIFQQKVRMNADLFPKSLCKPELKSEEDGLDADDLTGTFMISYALLGLGCLIFACQVGLVKCVRRRYGDILLWLEEKDVESDRLESNINEGTPESTQPSETQRAHGAEDSRFEQQVISKLDELCILVQKQVGNSQECVESRSVCNAARQSRGECPDCQQLSADLAVANECLAVANERIKHLEFQLQELEDRAMQVVQPQPPASTFVVPVGTICL